MPEIQGHAHFLTGGKGGAYSFQLNLWALPFSLGRLMIGEGWCGGWA